MSLREAFIALSWPAVIQLCGVLFVVFMLGFTKRQGPPR